MFIELLNTYIGECPPGLEWLYHVFSFLLLLFALNIVYRILDNFFSLFKNGGNY